MKVNKFLLLGNDPKIQECKNRLISEGFIADVTSGKEILSVLQDYDCIILPLPTISNGYISGTVITIDEILTNRRSDQYVLCGNIDLSAYSNCCSYYNDESFLIKNSQLTAQGVLKLILDTVEKSVYGLNAAVIGYGRCGKITASLLKGVGMNVTVFSRRKATITQAHFDGYISEDLNKLNQDINKYDVIVNTVPSNIITEDGVKKLSSNNIYIEVASKPYGFNINETDVHNFKYILGESLPGRFLPRSAGINIADTVIEILKEV